MPQSVDVEKMAQGLATTPLSPEAQSKHDLGYTSPDLHRRSENINQDVVAYITNQGHLVSDPQNVSEGDFVVGEVSESFLVAGTNSYRKVEISTKKSDSDGYYYLDNEIP